MRTGDVRPARHRSEMDIRSGILHELGEERIDPRFAEPYFPLAAAHALHVPLVSIWEHLWGLQGDGLIFLDPNGQQRASSWDNWRWRLTDRGRQAVRTGSWEPRDPQRYVQRIREGAPDVDDDALLYVREALAAFGAGCYIASSVMLGVAVEQVFGRLGAAFVGIAPDRYFKLDGMLSSSSVPQARRFDEFRKRLDPIRASVPDGLADPITMDAVADLVRVTRNDAGHPSGRRIDEDTAYTHLVLAGVLLVKMVTLARHFEALQATP